MRPRPENLKTKPLSNIWKTQILGAAKLATVITDISCINQRRATLESVETQLLQLLEHFLVMCGGPINAAAAGAGRKNFLGGKDVLWYHIVHGSFGTRLQQAVTCKTALQEITAPGKAKLLHNLTQLFTEVVTGNKNQLRRMNSPQSTISRENNSILLTGGADKAMAGQMPAVTHVLAYDSQPFCQLAKHAVGGEFHWQ